MLKIVLPDSFGFDEPYARLAPIHRAGGVDRDFLIKRASDVGVAEAFKNVKAANDHTLIHLIAMGASESYNANRNGDAFTRSSCHLDLPHADWSTVKLADGTIHKKSPATFADRIERGLLETYETFQKNAKVFKNHRNKPHKGDKVWGSVKRAAYNRPMDRVELLIEVPNKDWAEDLEKLANDQSIPFSMACWSDPVTPILTSCGYKPVSMIAVGDLVLTHRGRWRPVTKLNRRKYSGRIHRLSIAGLPITLEVTADHPLMAHIPQAAVPAGVGDRGPTAALAEQGKVATRRTYKGSAKSFNERRVPGVGWYHAKHLRAGDALMYVAPDVFPGVEPIKTMEEALQLADSLEAEFEAVEVDAIGEAVSIKPVVGHGLPPGLFVSDRKIQLAFLGKLFDSSASDMVSKFITWGTLDLWQAMALRDLMSSMGIVTLIASALATEEGTDTTWQSWVVFAEMADLMDVVKFSERLSEPQTKAVIKLASEQRHFEQWNFRLGYRIEKVKVKEVVDVDVYNFEVEEDESYLAGGLVSHNCSIKHDLCSVCGHKASKREHYCEHLTDNLTDMLKTGHVVAAVNENPNFFDISRVNRPADRIAWSLTKAASGLVRGADLVFDPDYAAYPDLTTLMDMSTAEVSRRLGLMQKAAEIEKRILVSGRLHKVGPAAPEDKPTDDARLQALAGRHEKLANLFRALSDRGVCLGFEDFSRLVLGEKFAKLANAVEHARRTILPRMFSLAIADSDPARFTAGKTYEPSDSTDSGMRKLAMALEPDQSLDYGPARGRLVRHSLSGRSYNPRAPLAITQATAAELLKEAGNTPLDPTLEAAKPLADQYLSYKLAFLSDAQRRDPNQFDGVLELTIAQQQS